MNELEARARKLAAEYEAEGWRSSGIEKREAALVSLLMRMAAPGDAEAERLKRDLGVAVNAWSESPGEWRAASHEVRVMLERARQAREEAER